ncbi:MAG: AraC family transcriptional regulator [Bacteroidota bacterium]
MISEKQQPVFRIVKSKLFIDENHASAIKLNEISRQAHFSLYHYIRLFKVIYGITPHQYLKEKRIEKAKLLLAQSELSISDICYSVGFESVSSFTTLFKAVTGLNPRRYRQNHLEKEQKIAEQPLVAIPGCMAEKYGLKAG